MQMAQADEYADDLAFLRGGGATGAAIAERDWTATPLGPLQGWPQSLRTALGMALRSALAMALMWGEQGVVFYNDAFARTTRQHWLPPLGLPVREAWPELADFNTQVLTRIFGGETMSFREFEMTVHPAGKPETVWFDLDYSPIVDEQGRPAGMLCVVFDRTEHVLTVRRGAAQAERQ